MIPAILPVNTFEFNEILPVKSGITCKSEASIESGMIKSGNEYSIAAAHLNLLLMLPKNLICGVLSETDPATPSKLTVAGW